MASWLDTLVEVGRIISIGKNSKKFSHGDIRKQRTAIEFNVSSLPRS